MPPSIDDTARPAGSVVERHGSAPFVTERVGAVGLGHMGHAFAVNLVEDGYRVLVYDSGADSGADGSWHCRATR